jgi:hypothetical protein
MLSFHSTSPIKPYLAELMYIVTLLVATGPILIRTSIHGMVVNILQLLSTETPLREGHIKKLHFLANDISESNNRVLFGITEENINAFTISRETLVGNHENLSLQSLEIIVKTLIEAMSLGAPSIGIILCLHGDNTRIEKLTIVLGFRYLEYLACSMDGIGDQYSFPIQPCHSTPSIHCHWLSGSG